MTAPIPFDLETITITRRDYVALKNQAGFYQSLHQRAVKRIEAIRAQHHKELTELKVKCKALKSELEHAQAKLRGLRQQAFGKQAERADSIRPPQADSPADKSSKPTRSRGQQPGWQGHGRTKHPDLLALEQVIEVDPCGCPKCGLGFVEMAGTHDSEVLKIDVKAYRRVVRRKRLRASCQCLALPGIATAPASAPPQLFPRGKLGISLMVHALLSKFRHGVSTYRLLQQWQDIGLSVAQGTLTGNLQQLRPLFAPLVDAGLSRLRTSAAWHADETPWEEFDPERDRLSARHYCALAERPGGER